MKIKECFAWLQLFLFRFDLNFLANVKDIRRTMGIGKSNLNKIFSIFNLVVKREWRPQNPLKAILQKISVILNSFLLRFGVLWQIKPNHRISFRCTQNTQQTEKTLWKANSVEVLLSKLRCGQWKANWVWAGFGLQSWLQVYRKLC